MIESIIVTHSGKQWIVNHDEYTENNGEVTILDKFWDRTEYDAKGGD